MTEQTETNLSNKHDGCSYRPDPHDLGLYKLMATINGEQRKTVRVLRSWKLQSSIAPAAGLRYDGLYKTPLLHPRPMKSTPCLRQVTDTA